MKTADRKLARRSWAGGLPALLAAWLAAALLAVGCGGGGVGSGGTGAPLARATGTGTITGFGSVVIDGIRYDDSDARAVAETQPGVVVGATLALGQSVEVELDGDERLASIAVEARLVAPVDAVGPGAAFSALGQTVRINGDPDIGPVTLFAAPLQGLGSLARGDVVEVHGVIRSGAGGDVLQATRIERRSAAPSQWRVVGRAAGVGQASFSIGGLTIERAGAALLPAGVELLDGQTVRVFGTTAGAPGRLRASEVRVFERASSAALDAQVGGTVDDFDGSRFSVNGVRVEVGSAQIVPAGRTLADGVYARVRGAYRDADGVLVASRIQLRNRADAAPVELAGSAVAVDAAAATLRVRDTLVYFADARLQGCPGGIVEGGYVEVSGSVGAGGVVADTVRCRNEPGGAVVERRGVVVGVDPQRRTFELSTRGNATVTVSFDDRTRFDGVTPTALAGASVRVEGRFSAGVLVAQVVSAL